MKFKRVWHPCGDWEELHHGQWDAPVKGKRQLSQAIEFTGNHKLYGEYMQRVVNEWPISCENALTDYSLNRRAWIGHAACALAHRLPESIVRIAWGKLTDEQRLLANKQADAAISRWEQNYAKTIGLSEDLEKSLL